MPASVRPTPLEPGRYDFDLLERELDRTKAKVFLSGNSAFLGPLMCSMQFIWTDGCPTAATDYNNIYWNPEFFIKNSPKVREFIMLHELWHCGKMHGIRIGNRRPKIWNFACDININNDLDRSGHSSDGIVDITGQPMKIWRDPVYGETPPEDIYDDLVKKWGLDPNWSPWVDYEEDLFEPTNEQKQTLVNNVMRSCHEAKIAGNPGSIPGETQMVLEQFLRPVVPWDRVLYQWFNDLIRHDYTWKRPNRRYTPQDLYLPSRFQDTGRLEHLIFYQDVSGSISVKELLRFNSELKYLKEQFKPKKMTIVQFDTMIQKITVIEDEDVFQSVEIVGGGGTCLAEVREHIMENQPTAAVIFSDLYVEPMKEGPTCPIIWACVNQPQAKVPFGTLIHVKV